MVRIVKILNGMRRLDLFHLTPSDEACLASSTNPLKLGEFATNHGSLIIIIHTFQVMERRILCMVRMSPHCRGNCRLTQKNNRVQRCVSWECGFVQIYIQHTRSSYHINILERISHYIQYRLYLYVCVGVYVCIYVCMHTNITDLAFQAN